MATAMNIKAAAMVSAIAANRKIAASLIHLHFHNFCLDELLAGCGAKSAYSAVAAFNNFYQAMDSYEDEQN
ncbi:hypothetical protein SLEP1_g57959 [Rubroshorea leprosula]|uniref:Uncharacterized protein n=1 Tax=Rubroshorea leprosula TaxID=152421 RepID=A0AAV5MMQ4_9ROSI|nr:hypothetical protein SLEP1_g57959 [Rubroshorea leprosula]